MDLDEIIFTKIVKYFGNKKKSRDADNEFQVQLEDIKPKLILLARAFSGCPIEIFPATQEGGYKGNNLFLPLQVNYFNSKEYNTLFYFFRVIFLTIQRDLNHCWAEDDDNANDLMASRQIASDHAFEVLDKIEKKYPMVFHVYEVLFKEMQNQVPNRADIKALFYGKWMAYEKSTIEKAKDLLPKSNTPHDRQLIKTVMKAKAVEEIKSLQVDLKAQEDYVLTHNFEKVETAEEFNGTWRDFDGEDTLQDHHDAIEELNMKWTVRVDDLVHSVYQAEFMENTTIHESNEIKTKIEAISYPEWDYKKRAYREHHVKVFPTIANQDSSSTVQKTLEKYHLVLLHLRKMMASYHNKLMSIKRQKDGSEIDIDAITDMYVDIHAGKSPQEYVFINRLKRNKNLGILLLIDASLSSDGYVAGNRIIDVAKEVSILFGEILNEYHVDFSIAAFHSHTRNHIEYITIKDFNESWHPNKNRIGGIQPSGYTRIGGALRHAATLFDKSQSNNKWLILLSDGKPNDYDTYEGQYGIHDVKQSLYELNQSNINSYAFALEAQAKYYLPQMFGQNHYQILSSPDQLIHSLIKLYEKIRHGQ